MPNYEELYYIARGKYNQAVEERNRIRNNTIELQSQKNRLTSLLAEKQSALKAIQDKKSLIQDALDKCRHILDDEYPNMKKDLQMTGEEYKKIITSDIGVADLESIYSTDFQSTMNDLNSIVTELNRILKNLESQETTAQNELNSCNSELSTITIRLNNVGNEASAQYINLEDFNNAEQLCNCLPTDVKEALMEEINKAKAQGGSEDEHTS